MLRAQNWAARGYDLSKKRLCSTRTVRAPVPPLSARVAGQGCLLGLRHGACPGAVLNTLQAIALDATRRLHPLALSSIVSTLGTFGSVHAAGYPQRKLSLVCRWRNCRRHARSQHSVCTGLHPFPHLRRAREFFEESHQGWPGRTCPERRTQCC